MTKARKTLFYRRHPVDVLAPVLAAVLLGLVRLLCRGPVFALVAYLAGVQVLEKLLVADVGQPKLDDLVGIVLRVVGALDWPALYNAFVLVLDWLATWVYSLV